MERNKIKALADKLIKKIGLGIPINFDELFDHFSDLEIRYDVRNLDVEGRIIVENIDNNTMYVVELRGDGRTNRDRFTIAHELGHLFLGHVKQYEVLYRRGANELEYAANQFAADLLMPEDEFIKKVNSSLDENQECDISAVSEYFQVSDSAVLTRGKFLGIFKW